MAGVAAARHSGRVRFAAAVAGWLRWCPGGGTDAAMTEGSAAGVCSPDVPAALSWLLEPEPLPAPAAAASAAADRPPVTTEPGRKVAGRGYKALRRWLASSTWIALLQAMWIRCLLEEDTRALNHPHRAAAYQYRNLWGVLCLRGDLADRLDRGLRGGAAGH